MSAVYQLPHQLACLCKALIRVRHLMSTAVMLIQCFSIPTYTLPALRLYTVKG